MTAYYTVTQAPTRYTLGRAAPISAELQAIADAFAKIPEETTLKRGRVWYAATVGGTADAITLTMPHTMAPPYGAGDIVFFKAASDNTGAATVNIDGVGAVAIKQPDGSALVAGNIQADGIVLIAYNGTYWMLAGAYLSADQATLAAIAADITTVAAIAAAVSAVAAVDTEVAALAAITSSIVAVAAWIAGSTPGPAITGPGLTTDNGIMLWDGPAGGAAKDSGVTLDSLNARHGENIRAALGLI